MASREKVIANCLRHEESSNGDREKANKDKESKYLGQSKSKQSARTGPSPVRIVRRDRLLTAIKTQGQSAEAHQRVEVETNTTSARVTSGAYFNHGGAHMIKDCPREKGNAKEARLSS